MDAVIIAVASGKGGTGKSTTSVFMGAALAAMKKKVVLMELSPGLRSVDIMTGVTEKAVFDMEDVLSGLTSPARAVIDSPVHKGLSLLPAPYQGGEVGTEALQLLCGRFRPHFDYIILDVAAGYGDTFEAAALTANRLVLVETPDIVALRDGHAMADYVQDLPLTLRLVLNKVDARQIAQDGVLKDLDEAIDIVGVQLLGVVPASPVIQRAGASGQPLPAQSVEGRVYSAIARRIVGEDVPLVVR